jgi:hypothetical protein
MSKIKSRYFDFIESRDYADYFLNGDYIQQLEASKTTQERFSSATEYKGTTELRNRLKTRFKQYEGSKE